MIMQFDRDQFAGVTGTSFVLKAAERTVNINLVEVTALKERPGLRSFSILFRVPKGFVVEQGLYDLEHESLGALQLFLVPVAETPEGIELEAVFNFVREDESGAQ